MLSIHFIWEIVVQSISFERMGINLKWSELMENHHNSRITLEISLEIGTKKPLIVNEFQLELTDNILSISFSLSLFLPTFITGIKPGRTYYLSPEWEEYFQWSSETKYLRFWNPFHPFHRLDCPKVLIIYATKERISRTFVTILSTMAPRSTLSPMLIFLENIYASYGSYSDFHHRFSDYFTRILVNHWLCHSWIYIVK